MFYCSGCCSTETQKSDTGPDESVSEGGSELPAPKMSMYRKAECGLGKSKQRDSTQTVLSVTQKSLRKGEDCEEAPLSC